ncbi:MAG: type II toxin-antitoxin system HicB family antitoxin [Deltaproteobacteria bacterium]|nr:type II toxin-antitoxin system HicB family antitoxin [Deltaproteobacteria bacterium]
MSVYKVVLEPCDEGGYVISCPAIPGCHSQGETKKEAMTNIKEAIEGCLEVLNEQAQSDRDDAEVLEVAV